MTCEVCTQQSNHTPRKRLGSRSPADYPTPDIPPEHIRSAVERMANHFNREIRDIEAKWDLIKPAREHYEIQSEESQHKLMKQLGKYPSGDIQFPKTQYLAHVFKYPDQTYRSEYFMAILRHKREEEAKRVFNEPWRAGCANSCRHQSQFLPKSELKTYSKSLSIYSTWPLPPSGWSNETLLRGG